MVIFTHVIRKETFEQERNVKSYFLSSNKPKWKLASLSRSRDSCIFSNDINSPCLAPYQVGALTYWLYAKLQCNFTVIIIGTPFYLSRQAPRAQPPDIISPLLFFSFVCLIVRASPSSKSPDIVLLCMTCLSPLQSPNSTLFFCGILSLRYFFSYILIYSAHVLLVVHSFKKENSKVFHLIQYADEYSSPLLIIGCLHLGEDDYLSFVFHMETLGWLGVDIFGLCSSL